MNASTFKKVDVDKTRRVFMRHEKRYMKREGFVVGIVGSREWTNREKVNHVITTLQEKRGGLSIASGGADGADKMAMQLALHHGIPYKEFTPEHEEANKWTIQQGRRFDKKYSARHFFKRNAELANYVDLLVAFIPRDFIGVDDKAKGTKYTIKKAKRNNTKVTCVYTKVTVFK